MATMGTDGPEASLPTDVLFRRVVEDAVSESVDDHAYWDKIRPLQRKPPQEVWALVAPLAGEPDPDYGRSCLMSFVSSGRKSDRSSSRRCSS
jgi:hypothetical protein